MKTSLSKCLFFAKLLFPHIFPFNSYIAKLFTIFDLNALFVTIFMTN